MSGNQDFKAQILGKLEWLRINHDMSAKTMTDQEYWRGEVLSHIESLDKLFQDPNVFIGRWQSMESAPRDGTEINLWSAYHKRTWFVMSWRDNKWWSGSCGYEEYEFDPTAWAHLPTAPEVKE